MVLSLMRGRYLIFPINGLSIYDISVFYCVFFSIYWVYWPPNFILYIEKNMKITTFEFPKGSKEHEFPAGAVVADLVAQEGGDAVVKQAGQELSLETPLADGMILAISRKNIQTGEKVVKKIAWASDLKKQWKKAIKLWETELWYDEWLEDEELEEEVSLTKKKGLIIFNIEKSKKYVEFSSDVQMPESINVIGALQLADIELTPWMTVEINGKKASFWQVLNDWDKLVIS